MFKLRRPSPGLVVATMALILACAGSATAGSLISSKQIKNNSIKSADIKNRSIKGIDLHKSAIPTTAGSGIAGANGTTGAKGNDGAPGPIGPKGDKGDTGDRGPSNATMVHRDGAFDLDNANICPAPGGGLTICAAQPRGATASVGEGSYVAFGKVLLSIPGDHPANNVTCKLTAPGAEDIAPVRLSDKDADNAAGDANGRTGDVKEIIVPLQTAFTAPAGTSDVSLTCVEGGIGTANVTAEWVKLTAIQVGDLDVSAVTG